MNDQKMMSKQEPVIHLNREIKRTRRADIWNVPSKMDTAHCIFDQCADLAIEALQ